MEKKNTPSINISAPNLINICVDDTIGSEICGRMYHCYSREPALFSSVVELVTKAERLFDGIAFPQASTQTRCFREKEYRAQPYNAQRPAKLLEQTELIQYTGRLATLVTWVRFRQKATWQGETIWVEQEKKQNFRNMLELMEIIEGVIEGKA